MNQEVSLEAMRSFFKTHATLPYDFRINQLKKLKEVLLHHEEDIYTALYSDLKKSREEAYISELGLVIAEIKTMIRHLKKWMKPETVPTNLVNLPSVSKLYRDPFGVVLIISPWNYPLQLSLMILAGAIVAGNCAVIKPSEFAPATASILEKMLHAVFPPQYIRVVQGDGEEVVKGMMESFRFDYIFYTGSTVVGRSVYEMAAKQLIPVTLELGGKSPCIIEGDANIPVAAKRIVFGKFLNAGQTCIAPDYILVHTSVKEKLLLELKKSIEKFYGSDASESHDYGKIINKKRFEKLVSYFENGKVVVGGENNIDRLYIAPTIIDNVSMEAPVMKEEIFGPVLPVFAFDTMEDAVKIIEYNPNPLAFYLFTNDTAKQKRWIEQTPFGGGSINNTVAQFANSNMPLGGCGNSGLGQYHGKFTFDQLSRIKPVLKTPTWFDPAVKYPSFKGKLKLLKKVIG